MRSAPAIGRLGLGRTRHCLPRALTPCVFCRSRADHRGPRHRRFGARCRGARQRFWGDRSRERAFRERVAEYCADDRESKPAMPVIASIQDGVLRTWRTAFCNCSTRCFARQYHRHAPTGASRRYQRPHDAASRPLIRKDSPPSRRQSPVQHSSLHCRSSCIRWRPTRPR